MPLAEQLQQLYVSYKEGMSQQKWKKGFVRLIPNTCSCRNDDEERYTAYRDRTSAKVSYETWKLIGALSRFFILHVQYREREFIWLLCDHMRSNPETRTLHLHICPPD